MRKTADRTISFSDVHWELLERLAREHHMSKAEVNRKIYDFAVDNDAEVGLPFFAAKKKVGQAEVDAADGMIRELEAKQKAEGIEPPKAVFEKPHGSTNGVVGITPMTEREEFEHFVGRLPDPSMLGVAALRKVNEILKAHPEWVPWLAEALDKQRDALFEKLRGV